MPASSPVSRFCLVFVSFFFVFGFQFSAVCHDVPKCDFFVSVLLGVQGSSGICRLMVCISFGKCLANTPQILLPSYPFPLQVSDQLHVRASHCNSYIFNPLFCFFFFIVLSLLQFNIFYFLVFQSLTFLSDKLSNPFKGLNIRLRDSPVVQRLKRLPGMWETGVQSLGWEDPLEKEMATHSSTLAWRIPWKEEPGRLQSMGSQRVGHD